MWETTLTTGGYPKCSVKSSVSELADVAMLAAHDLDTECLPGIGSSGWMEQRWMMMMEFEKRVATWVSLIDQLH